MQHYKNIEKSGYVFKCLPYNEEGWQSISQMAGCSEHTVSSFV